MGEFHEFNKIIQTKNELQKCNQIEMQQVERKKKRTIQTLDHRITRSKLMIFCAFYILKTLLLTNINKDLELSYID